MLNKKFTYIPGIKSLGNDLNAVFKVIQLSSFDALLVSSDLFEWLDSRNDKSSSWSKFDLDQANFKILSVLDIVPQGIASEVAYQNKPIVRDFINNIDCMLDKLLNLGINSCSLNLSLENAFKVSEKEKLTLDLLKKISPYLIRKKVTMLLPVRIPSIYPVDFNRYSLFIRKVMNPDLKLVIEIYPHEFRVKQNPIEVLKPFIYKIGMVNFIYEPEAGNYLVDKLLISWLDALEELSYEGVVVLTPRTAKAEVFANELKKLIKLME